MEEHITYVTTSPMTAIANDGYHRRARFIPQGTLFRIWTVSQDGLRVKIRMMSGAYAGEHLWAETAATEASSRPVGR